MGAPHTPAFALIFTLTLSLALVLTVAGGSRRLFGRRPANDRSSDDSYELDFTFGIDEHILRPLLTTSGNGNGEFQMYVNSNRTTYVANQTLFIKPALTEHLMHDLNEAGNLYVARTRGYINNTAQPWQYDNDFYVPGPFAGRRMVLPYKHVRYQTDLNNTCDDTDSAQPDPSSCPNMWEHAYNVMDMNNQAWGSGRWDDARCTQGCIQTAGDYVPEQQADYTYNLLSPVASARLHTRLRLDMRFSRVEVTAKLPRGDWLWPAIWMLPSYPDPYGGVWPGNGEIDIMEERGNSPASCDGGYNSFGSTLHWGPEWDQDAYDKTTTALRFSKNNRSLTDSFHVYGLEWNETSIVTYLDDPSNVVFSVDMSNTNFWQYGQQDTNTCILKDADAGGYDQCAQTHQSPARKWDGSFVNPWQAPHNYSAHMAPFDAPFHLILNVAVGGTNGFFDKNTCKGSDGSDMPWTDAPDELPQDAFMKQAYRWLPTWVEPENIAWAAHCSLGSALELCMPSNSACPVKDMTKAGASDQLRSWYQSAAGKCTGITSKDSCTGSGSCEWHELPCPPTADHAALQIKSIKVFAPYNVRD